MSNFCPGKQVKVREAMPEMAYSYLAGQADRSPPEILLPHVFSWVVL